MLCDLADFLRYLHDLYGAPTLAAAVNDAVDKWREQQGYGKDKEGFLDKHYGVRGRLERGLAALEKAEPKHFEDLAWCLRRMGMPASMIVDFSKHMAPWDTFPDGAEVVVVVGTRHVTIPEIKGGFQAPGMGPRDFAAAGDLEEILLSHAEIRHQLRFHRLPPRLSRREAEAEFEALIKPEGVGMIAVIGSPVVNPMSDVAARRILPDCAPEDLPLRFRLSSDLKLADDFLVDPRRCRSDKEGVYGRYPSHVYPRIRDADVMAQIARGAGPAQFPDAAILALRAGTRPIILVAAGHGGCATEAAIRALADTRYIEASLRKAVEFGLPENCFFQPVVVSRRKPTREQIDDFEFRFPQDVSFPWREEMEALATPLVPPGLRRGSRHSSVRRRKRAKSQPSREPRSD
jgi:hypothetical protein